MENRCSRWRGLVGMAITGCGRTALLQGPLLVRIYWSIFLFSYFLQFREWIVRESTRGGKTLYIVLALFLHTLNKLRGWSNEGGTMAKYRFTLWQNGNPTPFIHRPAPTHKASTLGGASGAMTMWPISLKAYKSLSGLGFSTYQDAGKKKKKGFASLVMLAGKV